MIAIIVPVYNEESSVTPFINAIGNVLRKSAEPCEIIFVNDGSEDLTSEAISELSGNSLSIRQLHLCQNLGKQQAIFYGLKNVVADGYLIMDVDLQDPVHFVPILIDKFLEGYDSVFTQRAKYNDSSFIYSLFARLYYYTVAAMSSYRPNLHSNDYSIISSSVRNEMVMKCSERTFVFRCARDYFAVNQCGIKVERGERYAGTSSYTLYKRVRLVLLSLLFLPSLKRWIASLFVVLGIVLLLF